MVVFTQRGAAYVPVHDRGLADKPSALSPRLGGSTEGPFHDSHVGETFDRIPVLEYLPVLRRRHLPQRMTTGLVRDAEALVRKIHDRHRVGITWQCHRV